MHRIAERSGVNCLRAHSALVLHEQTHVAATRLVRTAVILNSSTRVVDHFQTVGHLIVEHISARGQCTCVRTCRSCLRMSICGIA